MTIFVTFLDGLLVNLQDRFASFSGVAAGLSVLIPAIAKRHEFPFLELKPSVQHFASVVPSQEEEEVEAEFKKWIRVWQREDSEKSISECDNCLFPNISTLLKIYATLPVSTATRERSFSSLKFLKNYLHSTMCEERLNGLALAYIHKDMICDTASTISATVEKFLSKDVNRRARFN